MSDSSVADVRSLRLMWRRIGAAPRRLMFTASVLAGIGASRCTSPPSDPTQRLVGEYELFVEPASDNLGAEELVRERLSLRADGTFTQACEFEGGPDYVGEGEWTARSVGFAYRSLKDCWVGSGGGIGGGSLVIDWAIRNILIHPDLNVYYTPARAD